MKVTALVQAEGQNPVDFPYSKYADDLGVIQAVSQLLQMDKDESPFTPRVRTITIEVS